MGAMPIITNLIAFLSEMITKIKNSIFIFHKICNGKFYVDFYLGNVILERKQI